MQSWSKGPSVAFRAIGYRADGMQILDAASGSFETGVTALVGETGCVGGQRECLAADAEALSPRRRSNTVWS